MTPLVAARLSCSTGELAGSHFELGTDNAIGRDAENRLAVATPTHAAPLVERDVRIYRHGDAFFVETVGGTPATLDGAPIVGAMPLRHQHVIAVGPRMHFQFTVSAAEPDRSSDTMLDTGGLGALPDLKQRGRARSPSGTQPLPAQAHKPHTPVTQARRGAITAPPETAPKADSPYAPRSPISSSFPALPSQLSEFVLTISVPSDGPTTFPLVYGDNTIGRGDGCEVRIIDPQKWLSRKHAVVRVTDSRVELIDLQGRNGTFFKGASVNTATLEPGSKFVLGPHLEFTLRKR